jgi:hypothetical protein
MLKASCADRRDGIAIRDVEWCAELMSRPSRVLRRHGTGRVGTAPLNRESGAALSLKPGDT